MMPCSDPASNIPVVRCAAAEQEAFVVEDAPEFADSTVGGPPWTVTTDRAAPIRQGDRVVSIDVLRGVAVLGILLMNIVAMGLPFAAYDDPTIIGNRSPIDFWVWAVNAVLAEGKMRAIFSMLFGASVVLIAQRASVRGTDSAADVHVRRNLWLVLFGFIHSYFLLWVGDILFTYGVAGLPLFAFRRVRSRNLIILGSIVLALQAPKMAYHNHELGEASAGLRELGRVTASGGTLTPAQEESRKQWMDTLSDEKPTPKALQQTISDRRSGYLTNVTTSAAASMYLESMYLYKVGLWDAAGAMMIGMALLKMGVFSASRSYRFYLVMALAGYAAGIPLGIWVVADWMRQGFDAGARWTSLDDVTRMSIALGHVAVVMMICKAGAAKWATAPLAAVGRMALTNYIMQTVICMTLFCGFGFGWFGLLARHQLYYIVASVWAFELIASVVWLRWFQFGPLEWVWRWLTYRQRPPFRARRSALAFSGGSTIS
jgi:uncharacterized protein